MSTKKMLMIAISIAIIFTQEQLLMFLPNIQFTVLLIIVFTSVYSFKETMILITGYVFLDSMYMGGLNPFFVTPMLIAWYLIPISYHTILRKTNNEIALSIFAFVFGIVYGLIFIPFQMIQFGVTTLWPYLLNDIPFELIMAFTGTLTVLWMYKPLYNLLNNIVNQNQALVHKSYK
ncbi:MAG: hypothetical protein KJ847_03680 [Firmicutes bacterium]|nr:hypothetical protein [Bacillota bacterium]